MAAAMVEGGRRGVLSVAATVLWAQDRIKRRLVYTALSCEGVHVQTNWSSARCTVTQ